MKNVISIYDTTVSLILLTGHPTIAIAITLVYNLLLTDARIEIAAVAGSMVTATLLKSSSKSSIIGLVAQLCVLGIYHYNIYIGLMVQCILDATIFKSSVYQTKTLLKLCMFVCMLFVQRYVALCLAIVLVHAVYCWFTIKVKVV